MMFPCSALPPPLYPAFLRPPAALSSPLNRSLHSGFLVEDLLRWSQPVSYIHRTFSSRSPGDILPAERGTVRAPPLRGPGTERCVPPPGRGTPGSPQPGGPEPGYLKFGAAQYWPRPHGVSRAFRSPSLCRSLMEAFTPSSGRPTSQPPPLWFLSREHFRGPWPPEGSPGGACCGGLCSQTSRGRPWKEHSRSRNTSAKQTGRNWPVSWG
ncbi:hypothetical protein KUCAC02_012832 [Chaenocephalus aceratus]|uniref:Uncharacterized protein n=1 Tax=Chaenocephalus aceratus TaxID=36190 RepID=A0ACB9XD06_CHAAC|nr:hypothetical protein KUCAC02_012832 [Chaenocephalus aceratus]